MDKRDLEADARAALKRELEAGGQTTPSDLGYLSAPQLEKLTGTPESTWRYWAHIGTGPASFKLGRRRVWKRSAVLAWLEHQEKASAGPAGAA